MCPTVLNPYQIYITLKTRTVHTNDSILLIILDGGWFMKAEVMVCTRSQTQCSLQSMMEGSRLCPLPLWRVTGAWCWALCLQLWCWRHENHQQLLLCDWVTGTTSACPLKKSLYGHNSLVWAAVRLYRLIVTSVSQRSVGRQQFLV